MLKLFRYRPDGSREIKTLSREMFPSTDAFDEAVDHAYASGFCEVDYV